jgi:peptidoglycan/xylan/chitin deacetylase (PgdA/CDA1 family)
MSSSQEHWQPTRDFHGYGEKPIDPKWPNGARLAVNFVMNYEEGSEPSVQDGEGFSETGLTESTTSQVGMKGRDLAAEGMFEYGSRVGFWRLMRAFQERGLPMTVFGCALALERNPAAAAAIKASGFDVCSHGWRWIKHFMLTPEEEREHIAKAVKSFQQTVGQSPAGWYCRYGPSVNTRRLVVEHGGFTYDSDYYGDELPFWQTVEGKPHLIVPYSLTTNDGKYANTMGHSDQWFGLVKDAFDVLYREGATQPKMMSVGMHMRIIGHPGRTAGLWRLLDYMQKHDGVWITRRIDIANHWVKTHPYPGKGLGE